KSELFYPPVETNFQAGSKEPRILSVSRFTPTKKQADLVDAFRAMGDLHAQGWRLICAGGLEATPEGQADRQQVQARAAGGPVDLRLDLDRAALKGLFERASVFWHGVGLGEDEQTNPDRAEHFGIVTVEAMAAGCVPVVMRKGGQPEIVDQAVNGFLCATLEEM